MTGPGKPRDASAATTVAVRDRDSRSLRGASRRALLKMAAGISGAFAGGTAAGTAGAQTPPASGDANLARLQGARRILIKGGTVLTQDRAVGDFAAADIL